MRKILWHYNPQRCLICNRKIREVHKSRSVQLRVFDNEDKEIADMGAIHGRMCIECALNLFKHRKFPIIRGYDIEWGERDQVGRT